MRRAVKVDAQLEALDVRKMENGWSIKFCLAGKTKEVYVQTWAAVHDFVSKLIQR